MLFWFFDLFLKTGPYCMVLAGPDLMENLLSFALSAAVTKGRSHHSHWPTFTGNRTFLLAPWMGEGRGKVNLNGLKAGKCPWRGSPVHGVDDVVRSVMKSSQTILQL